ncbi:MAG: hypothetical protein ACI9AP_000931, partial [Flavobacteriales bacterium]
MTKHDPFILNIELVFTGFYVLWFNYLFKTADVVRQIFNV